MNTFSFFRRWAALLVASLVVSGAQAQIQNFNLTEVNFTVEPGSSIAIHSSDAQMTATCQSDSVEGHGSAGLTHPDTGEPFVEVSITSSVADLACDSSALTDALHRLLGAPDYPVLAYSIDDGFARESREDEPGDYYLRMVGQFSMAGISRPMDLRMSAVRDRFLTYRVNGEQRIDLSAYRRTPSDPVRALLQEGDVLLLKFELLLAPDF